MNGSLAHDGAGEDLVLVRLEDVDKTLRHDAANEIARAERLTGVEWLALRMAAERPRPARLRVPAWKAELVLRERKRPLGPVPRFK